VIFGEPEPALIADAAGRPHVRQLEVCTTLAARQDVVQLQAKHEATERLYRDALFPERQQK
jgi:hypothetical protein